MLGEYWFSWLSRYSCQWERLGGCLMQIHSALWGGGGSEVRWSEVAQSCPILCDPMNCSTLGLPVHHQLPEFTHTHIHRVGDAIQPSHSLAFHMMYSAYKLNKLGANIQPWCTPFPIWNQSIVPCPVLTIVSWRAYRFLRRQVRWSRIFHSLLWCTICLWFLGYSKEGMMGL